MNYFEAFERAVAEGCWQAVEELLADNLSYTVEGVPFACEIAGKAAVMAAFRKSTDAFDATMDFRMLEIQSITRLGDDHLRVELLSGYGREAIGAMTAPVTIEVRTDGDRVASLRDIYDPKLTMPALGWLTTQFGDADPSYV
ncbi:MAG: hypothetical protein AAGE43_06735 [Pseudomonadota bacterium]